MREWITYYLNTPVHQLTPLEHLIWSGLVVCGLVIVAVLYVCGLYTRDRVRHWRYQRRMKRRQKEHPQTFEEWKRGLSRPYDSPTKPNARK
jgi:uncharacterized membrane protein YciS (DUF1049 family)